ncbi:uncharacterized protein LOC127796742 isoform X2 [Diospyros lotus]|uniref:uncharacterized protein LOC127796742 isoform X2 n=1 Tax=Diospyros lotus TaxID=55363 RepID=UPI00225BD1E3|nr:uncharacterized protein LOC127796742 isoform X2 [Diospyros lotus]
MSSNGSNSTRGDSSSSPYLLPLTNCFPLHPITLAGSQKHGRSGELRRLLAVALRNGGASSEDQASVPEPPPPPAVQELRNFKHSLLIASRNARDRAKMLRESIFKLDKYRGTLSCKKRQKHCFLSDERSSGENFLKLGSQILQSPNDHLNKRFEDKTRTSGLRMKKRIRTAVVDTQASGQSSVFSKQQIVMQKNRDLPLAVCGGKIQVVEKIRRLPVGGEGWEKKLKRKRSSGTIVNRGASGDQDMKQAMHPKLSTNTKLRSSDTLNFRSRSSTRMSESEKLESFESASAKSVAALKNELGSIPHPRVSTTISEERVSAKGNNNIHEENQSSSPNTMVKGKVSRAHRTGSIMNVDSSPQGHSSPGALDNWELTTTENKVLPLGATNNCNHPTSTVASTHPMAQWAGQRPHKISRTRRTNLVSPVTNNDEDDFLSPGFAASDLSSRFSSQGSGRSVLAIGMGNNNKKEKIKIESTPFSTGLSEGKETGDGENELKGKRVDTGDSIDGADNNAHPSILLSRKNKTIAKEETGDGIHGPARVGMFCSSTNPNVTHMKEKVEKLPRTKQLKSIRRDSDKNKSKFGCPPSKNLMDQKNLTSAGFILNSSSNFTGESDDDREDLLAAANTARKASYLAATSPFWKKIEYIFASVSSLDISYLKQQLSFAEELNESLSQMLADEYNTLGMLMHKEAPLNSVKRFRSSSKQEVFKIDALSKGAEMGRPLDKDPSLFQRVLSSLIEEDESEELYQQNESRNMPFQCASDDSHCGSCNLIDVEPKDRDRMDSGVESEGDPQTQKHCFLDRFSCNKSASSNTYSNRSISSSSCNNEQWQEDDGLSHLDAGLVTRNSEIDLSMPHTSQTNASDNSTLDCQYQMLNFEEKLFLELQSIGLSPEPMPDLTEEEEGINQDILELQGGLLQQVERLKNYLGKIDTAVQQARDLERRDREQVAMNQLIEMAYRRLASRGSYSSKRMIRKIPKQVALAFVKRTLARCQRFEITGRSCFSKPPLQDVIYSACSIDNGTKSVDCVGSGTASNTYNEAFNHKVEARSSVIGAVPRSTERSEYRDGQGSLKQESFLNKGKRKEMLLDDVVACASPKQSVVANSLHGGSARPSLSSLRSDRKSKTKPNRRTNHLSTSGNGPQGRLVEAKYSNSVSVSGPNQSAASQDVGLPSPPVKIRQGSFKEAEEQIDLGNLQLSELDDLGRHQDLSSWFNLDEDGLQDHDSVGLEIPMDDLSDLNMLV